MRKLKELLFLLFFCFLLAVSFYSCDDSGVGTHNDNLTFTYTGLKTLNQSSDGMYEAWVYFGAPYQWYISCGKFNINSSGQIVDSAGTPVLLKLKYRPYDFNTAVFSLITIDPPNYFDTIPPSLRLLAGDVSYASNYLSANLTMQHTQALDSVGRSFISAISRFMLYTPTDTSQIHWYNGIWFSDTSNNAGIAGLSVIPVSSPWVYEAWLDSGNTSWLKIGRFKNPYGADDDAGGPYAGPRAAYQYPGEDWVFNSPPVNDLRSYWYTVHICLEPAAYPTGFSNHMLQLFIGGIPNTINMAQLTTLPNNSANLPTATMKISTQ